MTVEVAIVGALRSPFAKGMRGVLRDTRPDTMGAIVLKELIRSSKIPQESIDDVIVGCAMPEAQQGMNVARTIALMADIPSTASAATINRFCSSGLHAVADVAKSIITGQISVGIAGGVESMSMVPMGGNRPSVNPELISRLPEAYCPMGLTAENVARRFEITRAAQDEFSLLSHQRATKAMANGFFAEEIVPLAGLKVDEGPRADTTIDALRALKPAFAVDGSVTAGNSSQVSDGAAFVAMMDEATAKAFNLSVMGYFRDFVTAGVPPEIMGTGPVPAITKLLKKTGLSLKDIGVIELNEAFASQALYCMRELKLDSTFVNPNGGAIALGHPLGATGARQVATILREMKRRKARYGICSMCIGGGMGAAGLVELKH
jgi:acetyl-CoA acyltransferase